MQLYPTNLSSSYSQIFSPLPSSPASSPCPAPLLSPLPLPPPPSLALFPSAEPSVLLQPSSSSKEPLFGWALGQSLPSSCPIQDDLNKKCMYRRSVFGGCLSLVFWVKKHPQKISALVWGSMSDCSLRHRCHQLCCPERMRICKRGLESFLVLFQEEGILLLATKFGSWEDAGLAWKVHTYSGDEVERGRDPVPASVPRLLLGGAQGRPRKRRN